MAQTRGAPNYITRSGLKRMRDELRALLSVRLRAATPLGTTHDRAERAGLGARIARLDRRIASATLVTDVRSDEVGFGSTVLLADEDGRQLRVVVVGADEARPDHGLFAHDSAEARALLGRRAGEQVVMRLLPALGEHADAAPGDDGHSGVLRLPQAPPPALAPYCRYALLAIE